MDSRVFIKQAAQLIEKIELSSIVPGTPEAERALREEVQNDINRLFSFLHNPTLPSAYRLRDVALNNGYKVAQGVIQRLAQHENLS